MENSLICYNRNVLELSEMHLQYHSRWKSYAPLSQITFADEFADQTRTWLFFNVMVHHISADNILH